MPPDFDRREYWHARFAAEDAFEWLVPSHVFLSVAEPYLARLDASSSPSSRRILHLGFGTSDLQLHLRRRGFVDVTNVDYEPLAVQKGVERERAAFGDVRMAYEVGDATALDRCLPRGHFGLVLDKSAVDAIACAGEQAVLATARSVRRCLADDGVWLCLSFSSCRFELGGELPFDVEVLARIPTAKQKPTDPDIYYYCYVLRPRHDTTYS